MGVPHDSNLSTAVQDRVYPKTFFWSILCSFALRFRPSPSFVTRQVLFMGFFPAFPISRNPSFAPAQTWERHPRPFSIRVWPPVLGVFFFAPKKNQMFDMMMPGLFLPPCCFSGTRAPFVKLFPPNESITKESFLLSVIFPPPRDFLVFLLPSCSVIFFVGGGLLLETSRLLPSHKLILSPSPSTHFILFRSILPSAFLFPSSLPLHLPPPP